MTHVVHLTSVHYPFDTRIFHKQLQSLAAAGYQTTLIAHHDEPTTDRDGVRIVSLGDVDTRVQRWSNLPKLFRIARRQRADVYHIHDPELLPIGVLLSATTDAKIVYDVHEDYVDAIAVREWIPQPVKPFLQTAFPAVQSALTRALDLIVTADDSTRDRLAARTSTPVVSVRNLPTVGDIEIGEGPDREHDHVLTYVGGLDRERGLLTMLDLTARLRERGLDVGLWLLGPFQDDEIEHEARQLMREAGLTEHVRLFGYVDYADVFSHLASADIGLLLADEARFERNVPTKFFEYLSAGLPVVMTDIPSLEPYAEPSYAVTVSEDDLESMVEETALLLENTNAREAMGEAGREAVVSTYSWEVERERLLEAYEGILEE
jgi:glycosyltransferase involved in cell wall biosynthesis